MAGTPVAARLYAPATALQIALQDVPNIQQQRDSQRDKRLMPWSKQAQRQLFEKQDIWIAITSVQLSNLISLHTTSNSNIQAEANMGQL